MQETTRRSAHPRGTLAVPPPPDVRKGYLASAPELSRTIVLRYPLYLSCTMGDNIAAGMFLSVRSGLSFLARLRIIVEYVAEMLGYPRSVVVIDRFSSSKINSH